MDRAVEALKICADKLAQPHDPPLAADRHRSLPLGRQRRGVPGARRRPRPGSTLEIIDRETEARLAVSGCGSLVERDTDGVVLFDIGGGSSEIALIDVSRPALAAARQPHRRLDLAAGRRRLAGRALRRPRRHAARSFDAMVADVAGMLEAFEGRDRLDHLRRGLALPSARHVRHGDHAGRRASRPRALRPPPRRRAVDGQRQCRCR